MTDIEKIILKDSPEAATWRTDMAGWVSSKGNFFGNGPSSEDAARWDGCTHTMCPDCGGAARRGYTRCAACRETRAVERYLALESRPWDGKTPLYSEAADLFFFDADELLDYCAEHDCTAASLRLLLCKGELLRIIDTDYWCDELSEDTDLHPAIEAARLALNQAIRDAGPVAWSPTQYAADLGNTP